MLARAAAQAGEGAEMLFARLDGDDSPRGQGAGSLARWAERIRAGEWTPEIAELVAHAEALERAQPRR